MRTTRLLRVLLLGAALFAGTDTTIAQTPACTAARFNDWKVRGCRLPPGSCPAPAVPGNNGCGTCPGMPRWWVDEPNINLWVADDPLGYNTSSGQRMTFRFTHAQRTRLPEAIRNRYEADSSAKWWSVRTRLGAAHVVPYPYSQFGYSGADVATNALWLHNWWSEVLVWDETEEAQPPSGPDTNSTTAFFPFSSNWKAILFSGENGGGVEFPTAAHLAAPQGTEKTRVEFLGATSSRGGPGIPDVEKWPGGFMAAYPTNAEGVVWCDNPAWGIRIVYPDGSQDVFGFVAVKDRDQLLSADSTTPAYRYHVVGQTQYRNAAHAYLTQRIDAQGRITRIGYKYVTDSDAPTARFAIRYIVDPDGKTNRYEYFTNANNKVNYSRITKITDPYGRKAQLGYDSTWGLLNSITDAQANASSIVYKTETVYLTKTGYPPQPVQAPVTGWVTNLVTPYGTTAFGYAEELEPGYTDAWRMRAVRVKEPGQDYQLYLYRHQVSPGMPAEAPASQVPTVAGRTFDTGAVGTQHPGLSYRNSFHWNSRQATNLWNLTSPFASWSDALFSSDTNHYTINDYNRSRTRHWLLGSDGFTATTQLSCERDPSPDAAGTIPGAWTFYDYGGKNYNEPGMEGSDPLLTCVARQLPDGTTQFTDYSYYTPLGVSTGQPKERRESYTKPDGSVGIRTNAYVFAPDSFNLSAVTNAGVRDAAIAYNATRQPTHITNALGEVTKIGYDSIRPTAITNTSGATVAIGYYTSGDWNGFPQTLTYQQQGLTLSFTWTNGMPHTVSTSLGLTITNQWDGLDRLVSTHFPDGTCVSNVHDKLDLVGVKDRLGNWSRYGYDSLQHLQSATNANQAVTLLDWCGCGALNSVVNALNQTTAFGYNNQGLRTTLLRADGTSVTNAFDMLGRLTNVVDSAGRGLTCAYNNQGFVTAVSNAYGQVSGVIYDERDRPLYVTDDHGVTVTNAYDNLDRLKLQTWSGGTNAWGYTANVSAPTSFTNAAGYVTFYQYDQAGRLTNSAAPGITTNAFTYHPNGALHTLTDGNGHTTTWEIDIYGRATEKLDALNHSVWLLTFDPNGRVTNRWTPQFGNTALKHDAVGNLTNIVFQNSSTPSLQYSYDPLNRLTTMSDAVGASTFGYTAGGQLQTEDGPWTDDTLTFGYQHRLRSSLTLNQPSGTNWSQGYIYDNAWRLQTLTAPMGTFIYGYQQSGVTMPDAFVRSLALPNTAVINNHLDALGRFDSTTLANSSGRILDGYTYQHDALGLRTNIVRNWGLTSSTVDAGYDAIGQLVNWSAHDTNGPARLQEQLAYAYDPAGNLSRRTNNALIQTFTTEARNQLSNITRSGTFTASGNTPAPAASVTVNGQAAALYSDFTWASGGHTLNNGANTFEITAQNLYGATSTQTLARTLPQTVNFAYDQNGNLTNDGLRSFQYDAADQLTNVTVAGRWKTDFAFDGLGRKRIEREFTWSGSAWTPTSETHFVYDGMLVIQERDASNAPRVTYTRGIDLSGTRQGAGGIGALLARTDANGSAYYHADGSGNVTALMDANQRMVARYLFDAYGRQLGQWGELASANRYRFSSKEWHANSGLYYYGFRFYEPNLQRWLNPDPIGENGGINLYRFVDNSSLNAVDPFGLCDDSSQSAPSPAETFASGPFEAAFGMEKLANWIREGVQWGMDKSDEGIGRLRSSGNPFTRGLGGALWGASWMWGGPEKKAAKELKACEKAVEVLEKNKAAGKAFEKVVEKELKATKEVAPQLTLETKCGTKTRVDFATKDGGGNIGLTEAKSSGTARLTPNQSKAFPEIEEWGATVKGKGKPGFPGGSQVPPTKVDVVRP